jgi:hypothetical protein
VTATFSDDELPQFHTPLRAGTIVDGENITGPIGGCGTMPDCAAWLASGCRAELAGRNPAMYSSIVDVADLADGKTRRYFEARHGNPVGLKAGGLMLEFWSADCHQTQHRLGWWGGIECRSTGTHSQCVALTTLSPRTKWLTVTSNGNVHMRWTLS